MLWIQCMIDLHIQRHRKWYEISVSLLKDFFALDDENHVFSHHFVTLTSLQFQIIL